QADDRVADVENSALEDIRITNANRIELGSVHGTRVTKPPDAILAHQATVESRYHRIAQNDVVRSMRADLAQVTVMHDRPLDRHSSLALDGERDARNGHRLDQLTDRVDVLPLRPIHLDVGQRRV